jgi:two-component system, OmpR family, KDP operon response regulator KdpE
VLIVDRDPAIRLLVRRHLTAAGYRVHGIEPGPPLSEFMCKTGPDLVILDYDDAECGGREAIRSMREISAVPILALSIGNDENTTVDALNSGADDCIRKPFGIKELLARVNNALRRRALEQGKPALIVSGDLEIDLIHRKVRSGGRNVRLARKPYEVLRVLTENAGKVSSHEMIMRAVWGDGSIDRLGYLRLAIRQLRRQLEADPAHPAHIVTEPRVGYRLVVATGGQAPRPDLAS